MLGLKRGIVKLMPYQPEWHDEFKKEKQHLHKILNSKIAIEHIGSTAVDGLTAKPIIDIIIGLTPDLNSETMYQILRDNNYEDRGDEGITGRQLFVKGSKDYRTHHIHIVELDSELWNKHIVFRNYLKENKSACDEYTQLKQTLASKFSNNREAYTNGKSEFIKSILKNNF